MFLIITDICIELGSITILKGSLYLVECGLLESRLNLHTFVREHMLLKVAHGWFWFHKTISAYDSVAERQVTMPSLGDIIRGTVTGRSAIETLLEKPFGEDGNVSLLLYYSFHILTLRYYRRVAYLGTSIPL